MFWSSQESSGAISEAIFVVARSYLPFSEHRSRLAVTFHFQIFQILLPLGSKKLISLEP